MNPNDFKLNWIGRSLLALSATVFSHTGLRVPRWFLHPIMNRCWMMRTAAGGWQRITINDKGQIIQPRTSANLGEHQ